jgi:hypothetical protein
VGIGKAAAATKFRHRGGIVTNLSNTSYAEIQDVRMPRRAVIGGVELVVLSLVVTWTRVVRGPRLLEALFQAC